MARNIKAIKHIWLAECELDGIWVGDTSSCRRTKKEVVMLMQETRRKAHGCFRMRPVKFVRVAESFEQVAGQGGEHGSGRNTEA